MFKPNNTNKEEGIGIAIIFSLFNILALFIPMLFFYDFFFENEYWCNRWMLRSLLKKGDVKVINYDKIQYKQFKIEDVEIEVEGNRYQLWIWNNEDITLSSLNEDDMKNKDYIGLFTGSPITRWLKRDSIRRIRLLIG